MFPMAVITIDGVAEDITGPEEDPMDIRANDGDAKRRITNLSPGPNVFDVVATANGRAYQGSIFTVTITVNRASAPSLSLLSLLSSPLRPAFNPAVFDYTTTLPMGQESITLTLQVNPSTTNTSILLAYNAEPPDWYRSRTLLAAVSKPVASGSANVIALYPGTTTVITATVAGRVGTDTAVYSLAATRLRPPYLNDMDLSNPTAPLTPSFRLSTNNYNASVSAGVDRLILNLYVGSSPVVESISLRTVMAGGAVTSKSLTPTALQPEVLTLAVGENRVTITLYNGAVGSNTYTVVIMRQALPAPSSLTFSQGSLTPPFAPTTLAYTLRDVRQSVTINVASARPFDYAIVRGVVAEVFARAVTSASVTVGNIREGQDSFTLRLTDASGAMSDYSVATTRSYELRLTDFYAMCEECNPSDFFYSPGFDGTALLDGTQATAASRLRVEVGEALIDEVYFYFEVDSSMAGSTVRETESGQVATSWVVNSNSPPLALQEGRNLFTFVVTSPVAKGGVSQRMYVEVDRPLLPRIEPSGFQIGGAGGGAGALVPSLSAEHTEYSLTLEEDEDTLTLNLGTIIARYNVEVKVGDITTCAPSSSPCSDPISATVDPASGSVVTIVITDRDTGAETEYTITVTTEAALPRLATLAFTDRASSAALVLNTSFVGTQTDYTLAVPADTNGVCIAVTAADPTAAVMHVAWWGGGDVLYARPRTCADDVPTGQSTVSVRVEVEGRQREYTIVLRRPARPYLRTLSARALAGTLTLTPLFDPTKVESYTASVLNNVTTVDVTVTVEAAKVATYQLRGSGAASPVVMSSGTAQAFALVVGSNAIQIQVTDTATSVTSTYVLTVTRRTASVETLSALTTLTVKPGINGLNSIAFLPTTLAYTVKMEPTKEFVMVQYSTYPSARVEVNGQYQASGFRYNIRQNVRVLSLKVIAQDGVTFTLYTVTFAVMNMTEMAGFFTVQALGENRPLMPASTDPVPWRVYFDADRWTRSSGTGTPATDVGIVQFQPEVSLSGRPGRARTVPDRAVTQASSPADKNAVFDSFKQQTGVYVVTVYALDPVTSGVVRPALVNEDHNSYTVLHGDVDLTKSYVSFGADPLVRVGLNRLYIITFDQFDNPVTSTTDPPSLDATEINVQICPRPELEDGIVTPGRNCTAGSRPYMVPSENIQQLPNGTFEVFYNIVAPGSYGVLVYDDAGNVAQDAATNPLALVGSAPSVDPARTRFQGADGVEVSTLPVPSGGFPTGVSEFTISFKSADSTPTWPQTFAVAFTPSAGIRSLSTGFYVNNYDGTYTVSFNALVPGTYLMTINVNGAPLEGGETGYEFEVVAGEMSTTSVVIGEPYTSPTAAVGSVQSFRLQARDAAGVELSTDSPANSAALIAVTVSPAADSGFVFNSAVYNGDGTYTVSYNMPTRAQRYSLEVRYNGAVLAAGVFDINPQPLPLSLAPPVPGAAATRFEVDTEQAAGQLTYTFYAVDEFGNPTANGFFSAAVVGPDGSRVDYPYSPEDPGAWEEVSPGVFELVIPASTELGEYSFEGSVSPTDPSAYETVPVVDAETGTVVTAPVVVGPGEPGGRSTLSVPAGQVDVGTSVTCVIKAFDGQGNEIMRAGEADSFELSVVGDRTRSSAATDPIISDQAGNPGSYTATFTALEEDWVTIRLLVNGVPISQTAIRREFTDVPSDEADFFQFPGGTAAPVVGGTVVGEDMTFVLQTEYAEASEFELEVVLERPGSLFAIRSPVIRFVQVGSSGQRQLSIPAEYLTTAGDYILQVTDQADNPVDGTPYTFPLQAAALTATDLARARMIGLEPFVDVPSGGTVQTIVNITDRFGNQAIDATLAGLTVLYTSSGGNDAPVTYSIDPQGRGVLASAVLSELGATYTVSAYCVGRAAALGDSGAAITFTVRDAVAPESISAEASLENALEVLPAPGVTQEGSSEEPASLVIPAYDAFGNLATEDVGMEVTLIISDPSGIASADAPPTPVDPETGLCIAYPCLVTAVWSDEDLGYVLNYQQTTAGSYDMELSLFPEGASAPVSTYWTSDVQAGAVDAGSSGISLGDQGPQDGEQTSTSEAGQQQYLSVYLKDSNGNVVTDPEEDGWEINMQLTHATTGRVLTGRHTYVAGNDIGDDILFYDVRDDGAIIFAYTPTQAGDYSLSLTVNLEPVTIPEGTVITVVAATSLPGTAPGTPATPGTPAAPGTTPSAPGSGVQPSSGISFGGVADTGADPGTPGTGTGPGTGDAVQTTAPSASTGDSQSFSFQLTDAYGNVITTQSADVEVDIQIAFVDPETGLEGVRTLQYVPPDQIGSVTSGYTLEFDEATSSYTVVYLEVTAGTLTTGVAVGGTPLAGTPIVQQMDPGETSIQGVRIEGNERVVAGVSSTFTVVAADAFGNPNGDTGADFVATYNGQTVPMVSNGDGTYTGVYTPVANARLEIYLAGELVTAGCPGSTEVAGSGCAIEVVDTGSGVIDLTRTTISVTRLVASDVAGGSGSITVSVYDTDGVPLVSAESYPTYTISLNGTQYGDPVQPDPATGSVTIDYDETRAGTYVLNVRQDYEGSVTQVPYARTFEVRPAATSPQHTLVQVNGAIVTGEPFDIVVIPRDIYGNEIVYDSQYPASEDAFEVAVSGTASSDPISAVWDSASQRWVAEVLLTNTGDFSVDVTLDGESLTTVDGDPVELRRPGPDGAPESGEPVELVVENSAVSAARSSVFGEGLRDGLVGPHSFKIRLRDTAGNSVYFVENLDQYDCAVTLDMAGFRTPLVATCIEGETCGDADAATPCEFTVNYLSTRSGDYTINVNLCRPGASGPCPVGGTPVEVMMSPLAVANASRSVLTQESVNLRAGGISRFIVQTNDKYGNPISDPAAAVVATARRTGSSAPSVFGTVTYQADAVPPVFNIEMTFTEQCEVQNGVRTACYVLTVLLGGKEVGTNAAADVSNKLISPVELAVDAAAAVPGNTEVFVPDEPAAAGEPATILVQPTDAEGNPAGALQDNQEWVITIEPSGGDNPPRAEMIEVISPTGEVTYILSYEVFDANIEYSISIALRETVTNPLTGEVTEVTTPIGAPDPETGEVPGIIVATDAGPASPERTYVDTTMFTTKAGQTYTFDIYAFDEYGNVVDDDTQIWGFGPTSPYAIPDAQQAFVGKVTSAEGLYRGKFMSTQAGEYVLSVQLDGEVILASEGGAKEAIVVVVTPAATHFEAWSAEDLEGAQLELDKEHFFYVQPRDIYGNARAASTGMLSALDVSLMALSGTTTNPVEISVPSRVTLDTTAKKFKVTFTPTVPGTLQAQILIQSSDGGLVQIEGSPYTAAVLSKPVDPRQCTVSGPGLSGSLVGTSTFIIVTLRDSSGVQIPEATHAPKLSFSATPATALNPPGTSMSIVALQSDPGKYKITFKTVRVGSITFSLRYETQQVSSSASYTITSSSAAGVTHNVSKTVVSGEGLVGGPSGEKLEFVVTLRDTGGRVLGDVAAVTFTLSDASGQNVYAASGGSAAYDVGSDGYLCSYSPTSVGTYTLAVYVAETLLSPTYEVVVRPGALDREKSIAYFAPPAIGDKLQLTAGATDGITVVMEARDQSDNPVLSIPKESVYLIQYTPKTVSETPMALRYGADSQVQYQWTQAEDTFQTAGQYAFTVMVQSPGSEFAYQVGENLEVTVSAGAPMLANAVVSGRGLYTAALNTDSQIRVALYDQYFNLILEEPESLDASITLTPMEAGAVPSSSPMEWETGEGFQGVYRGTDVGSFIVGVSVKDTSDSSAAEVALQLPADYFSTTITSVTTDTARSTASGAGIGAAPLVAGQPSIFTIQARDEQGNPSSVGGSSFQVLVRAVADSTGATTGVTFRVPSANVTDNGDGTYTVSYLATKSGSYMVEVKRNGAFIDSEGDGAGGFGPVNVKAGPVSEHDTEVAWSISTASGSRRARSLLAQVAPLEMSIDSILTFSAATYDAYKNPTGSATASSNSIQITFAAFSGVSAVANKIAGGTRFVWNGFNNFTYRYQPSAPATNLTMTIKVNSIQVWHQSTTVAGGELDVSEIKLESLLGGEPGQQAPIAGEVSTVKIMLVDTSGNVLVGTDERFDLLLLPDPPSDGAAALLESSFTESASVPGTYLASYTHTTAGTYILRLIDRGNNDALIGRDALVTIPAASPAAESTQIVGFQDEAFQSGEQASFTIKLADLYDNPISEATVAEEGLTGLSLEATLIDGTTVTMTLSSDPALTIEPPDADGQVLVSFNPPGPGRVNLELEIDGVAVRGTYSASIQPGGVAPNQAQATGSLLEFGMRADETAAIVIQTKDSNGFVSSAPLPSGDYYQVSVVVGDADPTVSRFDPINDLGQYRATYTYQGDPLSDQTAVNFKIEYFSFAEGSTSLISTFDSLIYPTDFELTLDPSKSTLFLSSNPAAEDSFPLREVVNGATDVQGGMVGKRFYMFVQLKSAEGLDLQSMPESTTLSYKASSNITVNHSPVPGTGYYQLMLQTDVVGDWRTFDIKIDSTPIKVSSFVWHVGGGNISATHTTYGGAGSKAARAGVESTFTIYARDTYGNALNYNALEAMPSFKVDLVPDSSSAAVVVPTITPLRPGSNEYIVAYTPEQTGVSELHVYVIDERIGVETFEVGNGAFDVRNLVCNPKREDFQRSTPFCGQPYTFILYAFDAYENTYTAPPLSFQLTLEPKAALKEQGVTTLVFLSTGTAGTNNYAIDFEVAVAGEYSIHAELVGDGTTVIPGPGLPPMVSEFFGNVPFPANTRVEGPGISGTAASPDSETSFTVAYFDRNFNPTMAWGSESPIYTASDDLYRPEIVLVVTTAVSGIELPSTSAELLQDLEYRVEATVGLVAEYTVFFKPKYPGTYSFDIRVVFEGTPTTIGEGVPIEVPITSVLPPQVESIKLSPSLGEIIVTFDQATDQGSAVGKTSCSNFFSPATVRKFAAASMDPQLVMCHWQQPTGATWSSLYVQLENGATILPRTSSKPGDNVVLKEGTILNAAKTSFAASGGMELRAPDNPDLPEAILESTPGLGICDSLVLRAANSIGGGPFSLTYEYSVTSTDGNTVAVLAAVAEQNPDSKATSIYLEAEDLDVATYTFKLTVSTVIDQKAETTLVVEKEGHALPKAYISGAAERTVYCSSELVVQAVVQPPTQCDAAVTYASSDIDIEWTQLEGPELDVNDMRGTATPNLKIGKDILRFGETYVFQISVSSSDLAMTGKVSASSVTVHVIPSPIEVETALGSRSEVSNGDALTLTANPTDTMELDEDTHPWNFAWGCLGQCEGTLAECEDDNDFPNACAFSAPSTMDLFYESTQSITVPSGQLQLGYTYRFFCDISREPLTSAAGQRTKRAFVNKAVTTSAAGAMLQVEITLDSGRDIINSDEFTTLQCEIPSRSLPLENYAFAWEAVNEESGAALVLDTILEPIDGEITSTASDLVLKPGGLEVGSTFSFSCKVTQRDPSSAETVVAEGGSTRSILVNSPPFGGSLMIRVAFREGLSVDQSRPFDISSAKRVDLNNDGTPDAYDGSKRPDGTLLFEGGFQSLVHQFQLEALNWNDDDLPLTYSFVYISTTECSIGQPVEMCKDFEVITVAKQSNKYADTMLPSAGDGQFLYVGVVIADSYGAEARYYYPLGLLMQEANEAYLLANSDVLYAQVFPPTEYAVQRRGRNLLSLTSLPTLTGSSWSSLLARHLLQSPPPPESTYVSTARQLKELVFDPAMNTFDFSAATQFLDSWGRSYGRYERTYEIKEDTCLDVDDGMKELKDSMIEAMLPLLRETDLTSSNLQQFVCAMTKITWAPGEISHEQVSSIVSVVHENILGGVIESFYIRDGPPLTLGRSAECFFDFVNLLMRQTAVACDQGRMRNDTQMDALYNMAFKLGVQVARERPVGAAMREYLGQYAAISVQHTRKKEYSIARNYDIEVRVEDIDQEIVAEFSADLIDTPMCSNSTNRQMYEKVLANPSYIDNRLKCGSAVLRAPMAFAAVTFFAADESAPLDYISPLPSMAREDPRAFGPIAGLVVTCDGDLIAEDRGYPTMYDQAAHMYNRALTANNMLGCSGSVRLQPYALPKDYPDEYWQAAVRFFVPESSYAANRTGGPARGWSSVDVESSGNSAASLDVILPMLALSQYVAERPPSPPPQPPMVPPPSHPPPEIFNAPPLPPPVQNITELDMGIISGPVVGGIVLCAYIIYVFAQRRRLLQEIHLDYDHLFQDNPIQENRPRPSYHSRPSTLAFQIGNAGGQVK